MWSSCNAKPAPKHDVTTTGRLPEQECHPSHDVAEEGAVLMLM
jgi:hypothetical protein